MNKPKVGQYLFKHTLERNWGKGGGYTHEWQLVQVVKVGRIYFYARRVGWHNTERYKLEVFGTQYSSLFDTVESARSSFVIGETKSLLYSAGIDVRVGWNSDISKEQFLGMCRLFPGMEEALEKKLDERMEPVLELEQVKKEYEAHDNRD